MNPTYSLLALAIFASSTAAGAINTGKRDLIPKDQGECKGGWEGCPGNINKCWNCVSGEASPDTGSALIYDIYTVPQAWLSYRALRRLSFTVSG